MVPDPDDAERSAPDDPTDTDTDATDAAGAAAFPVSVSRRALLGGGLVATGLVGSTVLLGGDESPDENQPARETTPVAESEERRLAERFAPTLYFGRRERWFPTDPRPYASEVDGETVVDGFDALDGYTAARNAADGVDPNPTVFYRVRSYTERLAVVQYWLYSAFDQFSVNFHWHDWELLQAFVDRESGEAVLYAASAHSRSVPNNEFLEPERTPAVIGEVGSHSSALGMNESRSTFQRVADEGGMPDVTNGVLSVASGEDGLPLAYGLPRDEGFRLPYAVPELDGAPIYDHERLSNVSREDLVTGDLSISSFADLDRPPTDLPRREPGPVFEPSHRDGVDADERYALVPTSEVEDIAAFTGPQLSFDFYVPGFVEDAVASHLTTTSPPWTQPRYDDPLADVTDERHREAIESRFAVDADAQGATVVGRVRELQPVEGASTGVTLAAAPVEAVARLASDPVAVPTFGGVAAFVDVDPGDHTFVVNGPGYAPYAQRVSVGETDADTAAGGSEGGTSTTTENAGAETTTAENAGSDSSGGTVHVGSEGRVGLVPNEDAVKLEVDAADRGGVRRVRVADDAAGRLFDARPVESEDRAAVYVHRAGGYTVEVTDRRGETSVERVNPGPDQNAAEVAKARTGVPGITRFLVEFLTETRETARRRLRALGGAGGAGGASDDGGGGTGGDDESADQSTDADGPAGTRTPAPGRNATGAGPEAGDGEAAEPASPTATRSPEPTDEPTGGLSSTSLGDRLLTLLDEAVAAARRADEAAREGDDAGAAEALRGLREVLSELSSLADRDPGPQAATRAARNRIETADRRAERALALLEPA
jgi:hypothetical protein